MWDLEYAPTTSDWIINAINILGYISSGCSTSFFEKMLYFMHTSSRFIIFCCCCCFWTFLWLCGLVLKSIGIRTWLEIRRFFFICRFWLNYGWHQMILYPEKCQKQRSLEWTKHSTDGRRIRLFWTI